jgi:pimeloyl-ACP methyl ester carboxylesterase
VAIVHVRGADGIRIGVVDEGEGPAILVVHPGSGEVSSWSNVAHLLTDEFRVVRIQRRIYAADAEIVLPHTMAIEASDVLAVAVELAQPLLVGHSSGAVAALEAALVSPASFAAIVLYEPPLATSSPVAGEPGLRARAALDAGDAVEAMRIHMQDIVRLPAANAAMFDDPDVRARLERFAAAQIADNEAIDALGVGIARYAALDLPTVLIEGEHSPEHLRTRLADLAATLPNVQRIVTLEGQGHIAHMTAPTVLADVIRECAGAHALLPRSRTAG